MRSRLIQRFKLEPEEAWITGLMLLNSFSVLAFYFVLKALRAGYVLAKISASSLPYAYFLTAVFAGTIAALAFRAGRRVSPISLIVATYLVIIATLIFFHSAMGRGVPGLAYAYFVYVEIVSVLTTSQFWLLAGYLFDHRQSKRIFPLLGSGAIVGALTGSGIAGFLSAHFSTRAMIVLCEAACLIIILLSILSWRARRAGPAVSAATERLPEARARIGDAFRTIAASRHLSLIVLLVFFSVIAGQLAEWQAMSAAQSRYAMLPEGAKETVLRELFGRFYFVVNILGIALQLTMTGLILRRSGIGLAILVLPASMFVTSVSALLYPTLATALTVLGSNSLLRHSVNRVGMELLYLPLSGKVRQKIKILIDVFIDRFGRAVAGLIVLAFSSAAQSATLRGTAAAIMAVSAAGMALSVQLRRSYVETFRQRLARREVDTAELDRYLTDPSSVSMLIASLDSAAERQVVYGLKLLQAVRGVDFSQRLLPLLRHPSEHVRREAVATLAALPQNYESEAERLLNDPSPGVRAAAVDYLCSREEDSARGRIQPYLHAPDPALRLAVARRMAKRRDPRYRVSSAEVQKMLQAAEAHSELELQTAAWLAGMLAEPEAVPLLQSLLRDRRASVAAAAAAAAGRSGYTKLLPELLPLLTRRHIRGAAREACLEFGAQVTGVLGETIADPRTEIALRREIPWVLSRLPTARASEILVENLATDDVILRHQVAKALNRIHARNPGLPPPSPQIVRRIQAETRAYYQVLTMLQALRPAALKNGRNLLARALRERLDANLELIFRLMGLQYPQSDIFSAYTALKTGDSERRASAIEFLDNVLSGEVKAMILPLLEEPSAERLIERASRLFGIQALEFSDALQAVLDGPDSWLRACALHEIGSHRMREMAEHCRRWASEGDEVVSETARWALARIS